MKKYIIYALRDPTSKEVRYIGRSSSGIRRPYEHYMQCSVRTLSRVDHWARKQISLGFEKDIVVLHEWESRPENDSINEAEKYFIWFFQQTPNRLLNLTNGGEGLLGFKHSERSIEKMKIHAKKKGVYKFTEEDLRKAVEYNRMNPPRKGKRATAEQNMANSLRKKAWFKNNKHHFLGKKLTPQHIANIQKARAVRVIRSDGLIFNSIPQAARFAGADLTTIHDVLTDKIMSCHGHSYAYHDSNFRLKFSNFGVHMLLKNKRIARKKDILVAFGKCKKRAKIVFKGNEYNSIAEAARKNGIPKTTFFRMIKKTNT